MKTRLNLHWSIGVVLFLLVLTAETALSAVSAAWLEKAARALRNGYGLDATDNVSYLETLSPYDAAIQLMNHERFFDSTLAFNLYFKNIPERIRDDYGNYNPNLVNYVDAFESAMEAYRGHNYLSLLSANHPYFVSTFSFPAQLGTTQPQISQALLTLFANSLDDVTYDATHLGNRDPNTIKALTQEVILGWTYSLNFPTAFRDHFLYAGDWLSKYTAVALYNANYDIVAEADRLRPLLSDKFIPLVASRSASVIQLKHPADFLTLTDPILAEIIASVGIYAYDMPFWKRYPNTSTNHNFKRAAAILKNYFCDDMTPVLPVEANLDAHTQGLSEGGHASDPKCQACHYKLEPMGGFYRGFGYDGADYGGSGLSQITFDDNVVSNLADYASFWKAPTGSNLTWNVGYVRSTTHPEQNAYGSTLADLESIIKNAPEVKLCLAKRAFQFVNGPSQAYDLSYIQDLANTFTSAAQADSSAALKGLFASIVAGQTFAQTNPDPGQCYDTVGDPPPNSPPCAIRSLLKQNCQSCHNSQQAFAGLDLSQWVPANEGRYTFPHKAPDGSDIPRMTTLQTIVSRISSQDPKEQMPPNYFSSFDKERLYQWLINQISQ